LYREPDVVARNDAFNARPVVALPFFNSPESRRRKLASHRPTNGKARSLAATTDS
jgi:hypothetical protein